VLSGHGIENRVVHAAKMEVAVHNKVKTDKRDARKLGEQLEAGRLRGIYIPSEEQEQRRMLSRTRRQLVEQRTRNQNCIRMKAHQMGFIEPEDKRQMSHAMVKELLKQSKSAAFRAVVQSYQQIWRALDKESKELDQQLKEQANQDPYEKTYRSVPGVGQVCARILSNELGNMSQFDNERQLFSYIGLTPSESSSGDKTHRGSITKQGNRHVRAILIEVAWRAIEQDPELAAFFERISVRRDRKRAIVAVSRKLIGRIRAAFRHSSLYQIAQPSEPAQSPTGSAPS
jgi:transposase